MALYADLLDSRFGIHFMHKEGYNLLFIDGHGILYPDLSYRVGQMIAAGGISIDGVNAPAIGEAILTFLERTPLNNGHVNAINRALVLARRKPFCGPSGALPGCFIPGDARS